MSYVYTFPEHKKGDTFKKVTFTVSINGTPVDLTGASVKMDVRNLKGTQLIRYTSASGLTIVVPETLGQLEFDEQIVDIEAGNHDFDIEYTLSDGTVSTFVEGKMPILQDVTYD